MKHFPKRVHADHLPESLLRLEMSLKKQLNKVLSILYMLHVKSAREYTLTTLLWKWNDGATLLLCPYAKEVHVHTLKICVKHFVNT